MFQHVRIRPLSLALLSALIVAACGGSTAPTAAPASSAPTSVPAAPAATTVPAAAATTAPAAPAAAATSAPAAAAATTAPAAGGSAVNLQFFYPVAVPGPISQIIDGYATEFNQANPNIKVTSVLAGSYQDTLTKIQTTLQGGGKAPPTAVLLSTDLFALRDADSIMPMDQCLASSGGKAYQDDFFPAFMENSTADGKVWGIPFQRSTLVLYYNKDMFKAAGLDPEKAPANWDELAAAAQKLTKKDGSGNVSTWGIEIPSDGFPYWEQQAFAIEAGQNVVGSDPSKVMFNTPANIMGLQFWVDLSKKYNAMPSGVIQWGNTPNDFTGGKTAMAVHTTGSLTNILSKATFPVGVAYMPASKNYGSPTGGGNLYIFKNTSAAEQDAACKWIQFLTSPEKAADWSIKTGYVATRKSAYDVPAMKAYLAKNPQAAVARDQLQYAARELSTHSGPEIQKILGNEVQAAITGKKAPEQAMQDAQTQADKILSQFK